MSDAQFVIDLHNEAMNLCAKAQIAKCKDTKIKLYQKALNREWRCFSLLNSRDPQPQPTLAIVRQSTAVLAYHAGNDALCLRLVTEGLADPHSDSHVRMRLLELLNRDKVGEA